MTEPKLTKLQARFVEEYPKDMNAAQAAIRAGYSAKAARQTGYDTLQRPHVAAAIEKAMAERSRRVKIDSDWVLRHLGEMLTSDIGDIMEEDGTFKPILTWPKIWRQMLSSVDVKELTEGKTKNGQIIRARFIDRMKVITKIGEHIDVMAFKQRHEHTGPDGEPIEIIESSILDQARRIAFTLAQAQQTIKEPE